MTKNSGCFASSPKRILKASINNQRKGNGIIKVSISCIRTIDSIFFQKFFKAFADKCTSAAQRRSIVHLHFQHTAM